jgi:putative flippase GtrA
VAARQRASRSRIIAPNTGPRPTRIGAHRQVLAQLIRFGLVGGLSTLVYAAVYWPLATYWVHPLVGVVVGFSVAVVFGYVLHSGWSFKGHGQDQRSPATRGKFILVQLFGMALNALFTWVLTGPFFHGPTWWPLVPAVTMTPLATFALQRWWVFG